MTKPGINRPLVIKTSPRKVPTAHILLDSACHAAEQTLLDQRLFMVSGKQYQTLMDLLERPPQVNEGIRDLFSRKAPWSVE